MSRPVSKRTGWVVLSQGAVFILFGALVLFRAETEVWATVGLVIGLLGGGGMGTGLSLLLFPEHESTAEWEDEEAEYPDPMRTPPAVIEQDPIWFPRCRVHGFDQCAMRTRHCPSGRWNQAD